MTGVDKELRNPFVGIVEQEQATGGLAVASGTADFLIIGLQRIRNIGVNNKANVAPINAHSERVGSDNNASGRLHELFLYRFALVQSQTGMISCSFDSCPTQIAINLFNGLPGSGINNAEGRPTG